MAEQADTGPAVVHGLLRFFAAWLAGTVVAYAVGSISQSICVMRELSSAGAELTTDISLQVILHDLRHLAFGGKYVWYGANLAIGFLIALPCAMLVARFLKMPVELVASVAGAAAIVTMIMIVNFNSPSTIFAGTRGWDGMFAQVIAGAIGGAVFSACLRLRRSAPVG